MKASSVLDYEQCAASNVMLLAIVGDCLIDMTIPPTTLRFVQAMATKHHSVWWRGKNRLRDKWQYIPRVEECVHTSGPPTRDSH